MLPKVAIIYLSYHSDPYLDDAVSAWRHLAYPKDRLACVVVDNPHPSFGSSLRTLHERLLPIGGRDIPEVAILPQTENRGFAGGHNVGIRWAIAHGYDYVFLHNQDGFMAGDALTPLVDAMEHERTIGMAQPLILLYPETDLLNTSGNRYHYLGFGFCGDYRLPEHDLRLLPVQTIPYPSGAAVLIRTDLLARFGALDEDLFLYHEDMELSLRLRVLGYRSVVVGASRFYHKYSFGRSMEKFYWMERNRFAVLILFYRLPTLIILLPMLAVVEIGLWFFALRQKQVIPKRVAIYRYWLKRAHWAIWLRKRRGIQEMRIVSDRELLRHADTCIRFQEKAMEHPLIRFVGNPIMAVYYWAVVRTIVWW